MNKFFLDLGKQPLANNFQKKKTKSYYNLKLIYNSKTKLVSISKKIKKETMFNKTYPYRSSESLLVNDHFRILSKKIKNKFKFKNIFEIGSNDGTFAKNFSKKKIVCVEPCNDVGNLLRAKGFEVYTKYFDNKLVNQLKKKYQSFDLIFSANTITHIDKIENVFFNIKKILSKTGVIIIEEPSVLECFKKNAFDQFYNEHIYVLSAISLTNILNKVNLRIYKIENINVHGGSLRYFIIHKKHNIKNHSSYLNQIKKEKKYNLHKFSSCQQFAKKVQKLKERLVEIFNKIKSTNKIIIGYGASAKAVTIINYCKLTKGYFDYFIDTTKNKVGKYLPGTKILIKKYSKSIMNPNFYYFLGAWNFKKEIFKKEQNFIKNKGKFIVHLPKPKVL